METFTAKTSDELRRFIDDMGNNSVFRGQNREYLVNGKPSATTSFDRNGCIPSEMAKWSRYSSLALCDLFGPEFDILEYSQAILQHYGWRSFYLDASFDAGVGSWFAAHTFKSDPHVEMCEDYNEDPVLLRKQYASYDCEAGEGFLYVIDLKQVRENVGVKDLSSLNIDGFEPRFNRQKALLIGPLRNEPLPIESYKARIRADRQVFREYAAERGYSQTTDLFPASKDDPVLQTFLSLPWQRIPIDDNAPHAFRRTIELPEYQNSFRKRLPPSVALHSGAMISEIPGWVDDPDIVHFGRVPEICLFGTADQVGDSFPAVLDHMGDHKIIAFEVDQLIGYSNEIGTERYGKGIYVSRHEDGIFQVGEIIAQHPGEHLVSAGLSQGWFYEVDHQGNWRRTENEQQCPCTASYVHNSHLSALTIIEDFLNDPQGYEGIK